MSYRAPSTYQSQQPLPALCWWSSCHWRPRWTHWGVRHMAPQSLHSCWRRRCSCRFLRCSPVLLPCRKELQLQSPRWWSARLCDTLLLSWCLLGDKELERRGGDLVILQTFLKQEIIVICWGLFSAADWHTFSPVKLYEKFITFF